MPETTNLMSIADMLKYCESLKLRVATLSNTLQRAEYLKVSIRVVSNTENSRVEEVTSPTISISELTAERDATAKELRIVQQKIERANHTTMISHEPQY